MPAPTIPLIKLKEAPLTEDLDSALSLRRRRRLVPPGVTVVLERMGVLEEGAKKGDEAEEAGVEAGVEAAVEGVMGRVGSAGPPKRVERRPMIE